MQESRKRCASWLDYGPNAHKTALHRLRRLHLPRFLMIKAVSMLIIPLLYGSDHLVDIAQCTKDLEALIKRTIWGTARPATNWFAARALACQVIWLRLKAVDMSPSCRASGPWELKRNSDISFCTYGTYTRYHEGKDCGTPSLGYLQKPG